MISIIVPVYNGIQYIESCINNILKSIYTNIEIIIIDDGSTDGTYQKCEELQKLDQRIIVVHNDKNEGVSISRNKGIELVNGKYICFVDVDDILLPNALELLYQPSYDLICGNFELTQNGKIITDKYILCTKKTILNRNSFIKNTCEYIKCPRGTNNLYSDVWSKLYKTSIIKENNVRFHPYMTKDEVVAFNIDYAVYVHNCLLIPDVVYKYSQIEEMAYYQKYEQGKGNIVLNMIITFNKAKQFLVNTHISSNKSNKLLISFMNYYLNRYLYYNQLLGQL